MSRKEWDAFQDGKILVNDTDHSEGAKFEDRVLKPEWCCVKYHRSIAKVVNVIDPFKGDGYEATKKIIEELEKMIWQ